MYKTISKWEILEDCRRSLGEDIRTFVDRFERAIPMQGERCYMIVGDKYDPVEAAKRRQR